MLRRWNLALMAAATMVAGCGQAPSDEREGAAASSGASGAGTIKIRNEYQEKLLALGDLDRDLTLRRAVRDGGGSCPKISGSKYQQDYKSMAMWVAHCSSGDWAVFVSAGGNVQARSCKDIPVLNRDNKNLNLPTCHPRPVDTLAPVDEPQWPEPAPAPGAS